MPKAKAQNTESRSRRAFRELSATEVARLTETEKKDYEARLARHNNLQERKQAMQNAGKKVKARLDFLESALKTNVAKRGVLSSEEIDATFVCPFKRVMFATEERLIRFFDEGDLIQINCHAIPRVKTPCVLVRNGEMYIAQKINEESMEYANLDSFSTEENTTFYASEEEYIGEIVNVIRNPKIMFEEKGK